MGTLLLTQQLLFEYGLASFWYHSLNIWIATSVISRQLQLCVKQQMLLEGCLHFWLWEFDFGLAFQLCVWIQNIIVSNSNFFITWWKWGYLAWLTPARSKLLSLIFFMKWCIFLNNADVSTFFFLLRIVLVLGVLLHSIVKCFSFLQLPCFGFV